MIAIFEKDYTRDLISLVNDKRKQSIAEYTATDLNYKSISDIHLWYESIIDLINKSPPENYVKGIIITEDEKGIIETVSYKYCDKPFDDLSVTIVNELLYENNKRR